MGVHLLGKFLEAEKLGYYVRFNMLACRMILVMYRGVDSTHHTVTTALAAGLGGCKDSTGAAQQNSPGPSTSQVGLQSVNSGSKLAQWDPPPHTHTQKALWAVRPPQSGQATIPHLSQQMRRAQKQFSNQIGAARLKHAARAPLPKAKPWCIQVRPVSLRFRVVVC